MRPTSGLKKLNISYTFLLLFLVIRGDVSHNSVASRMRRPGRCSSKSSGFRWLSRGFSLARRPVSDGTSLPAVRYSLDFPQSSPSLSTRHSTASPTTESSTTAVHVHRGGSNPLSFLSSRRRGSTLTLSRTSVVYLTDPSLAGTPRSGASDGSSLVCLHRDSH